MSWERLEGRVTMYLAMAIYIHLTEDRFYGLWSIGVITLAVFAAWFASDLRSSEKSITQQKDGHGTHR